MTKQWGIRNRLTGTLVEEIEFQPTKVTVYTVPWWKPSWAYSSYHEEHVREEVGRLNQYNSDDRYEVIELSPEPLLQAL